jgi:NAD(P)H-nitrite reductase large subunit
MIVCHCHGVSDRQIRAAVRFEGAACVDDVSAACDAGSGCGGCLPLVEEILEAEGVAHRVGSHAPPRSFQILD